MPPCMPISMGFRIFDVSTWFVRNVNKASRQLENIPNNKPCPQRPVNIPQISAKESPNTQTISPS